jgi:hypothetical protein
MKRMLTALLTVLVGLPILPQPAPAQDRKPREAQTKKASAPKPALAVVNNPAPSYLSGEVNVTVRGDENPILRLLMIPSGQALVEFPAKDRIFKVNPADPDLVTIEDSPTKETDRYILLRSSKQFLPATSNSQSPQAATSIIVQMTSGMVITLLIHPAREFDQVIHRCVVRYDREAIVKARQVAGLAVNLDQRDESSVAKAPASVQIAALPKTDPLAVPAPAQASQSTQIGDSPSSSPADSTPTIKNKDQQEMGAKVAATPKTIILATETRGPKESKDGPAQWNEKVKWSKPLHGLQLAAQTRVLDAKRRQAMVSAHNTLSTPVNIAPAHPELSIQTLDDQGRVLQVEPVKPLKMELSNIYGLIPPGRTAFYLITYETPVLGAKQRLCVAVAQSSAADEPVLIELTKGTR